MITIDVAIEFSRTPFGRYRSDGDFSAEKFRDEYVFPQLSSGEVVVIDFTKVALGVGSSFLEETFGGLVRKGMSKQDLNDHLIIKDKMGIYDGQAKKFIEKACLQLKA